MICGIDEAGRGSVFGPLVVAAVGTDDDTVLKAMGVKDSKKLTPNTRERIFSMIIDSSKYEIVIASAEEIDARRENETINDIEADMFARAAAAVGSGIVYADCPDVDETAFANGLSARLGNRTVISRHKADDTFPVVSAASIVAKVTRDRIVSELSKQFGTEVGSGYPSDAVTMGFIEKWIKDNGCAPPHTRCSWKPVRRLLSIAANTKITEW